MRVAILMQPLKSRYYLSEHLHSEVYLSSVSLYALHPVLEALSTVSHENFPDPLANFVAQQFRQTIIYLASLNYLKQ